MDLDQVDTVGAYFAAPFQDATGDQVEDCQLPELR